MAKSHTPRGRSFSNEARTPGFGGGMTTDVRISLKRTTCDSAVHQHVFLFHHGLHQREPRFPQQVAHALLQHADDVRQRKDHLDVWILLRGDPAKLLHGSLLFDLVLSLHSYSLLFLGRKTNRRPIMAASLRVATFYDLPGIVQDSGAPGASPLPPSARVSFHDARTFRQNKTKAAPPFGKGRSKLLRGDY
jgi:hypothetical protein